MSTKLNDYYQDLVDQLNQMKDELVASLSEQYSDDPASQVSLVNTAKRKEKWTGRLNELSKNADTVRRSMNSPANTAADIEAFAASLRRIEIDKRAVESLLNEEIEFDAELERVRQQTLDGIEDLDRRLVEFGKVFDAVADRSATNNEWIATIDAVLADAASDSWIKTIKADASAVLNDADGKYKLAETLMHSILPVKVRARALERINNNIEMEADSESAIESLEARLDEKIKSDTGVSGALDEQYTVHQAQQDRLVWLMTSAAPLLQIAEQKLNNVTATGPMTSSQSGQVAALLAGAGIDQHFDNEAARNAVQRDVDDNQLELVAARARVLSENPEFSDAEVDAHAEVVPLVAALGDAGAGLVKDLNDANELLGVDSYADMVSAEKALVQAKSDLETATDVLLEADPGADPDSDPALNTERQAVQDCQSELDTAINTYTDSSWYALQEIQVAIPQRIWDSFNQLHSVRRMLESFAGIPNDLNDLKTGLDAAEAELVTRLEAEQKSDDGFTHLYEEIEALASRLNWLKDQRSVRLINASRGVE